MIRALVLILLLWSGPGPADPAWAGPRQVEPRQFDRPRADRPRPFEADTPAALARRHAGHPYILAFWSLECPHCDCNLRLLARLLKRRHDLPLALVAADPPEAAPEAAARLAALGLAAVDSWVFADPMAERLYYAVDRKWRGELPHTYFFDARHRPRAVTGALDEAWVERWLAEHL